MNEPNGFFTQAPTLSFMDSGEFGILQYSFTAAVPNNSNIYYFIYITAGTVESREEIEASGTRISKTFIEHGEPFFFAVEESQVYSAVVVAVDVIGGDRAYSVVQHAAIAEWEAPDWEGPFIYYSDFGAVGDGVTDDFDALFAAHEAANAQGLKVRADADAVYYIGDTARTVRIQTSTDWNTARFIIDDTAVSDNRSVIIFRVESSFGEINLTGSLQTLRKNQEKIDLEFERDMLIFAADANTLFYRRFSGGGSSAMNDAFRVDKNGYVDQNTPILWDFDNITSLIAYPIDEDTLYILGGRFSTIANRTLLDVYFNRGLEIRRSNVIVERLRHNVTNNNISVPYNGFLRTSRCTDIIIRDTVLTGQRQAVHGSYGFAAYSTLNLSLINVSQTNDINDTNFWGIMGANDCKNILFDNVRFSRFDVHRSVHNVTIKNSRIGHQGILVTGSGTLRIENTIVSSRSNFLSFRGDWGSTWNGDVYVIDSIYDPFGSSIGNFVVFRFDNDGMHDFGFPTYMPRTITVDRFTIHDRNALSPVIMFSESGHSHSGQELFPYHITEEFRVSNLTITSGNHYTIPNLYVRNNMQVVNF